MTHEEVQQQLDSYALGVLDDVTARRIASHLAEGCDECQAELRAWESTVGTLAYAVTPVNPSSEVKQRLLAKARSYRQTESSPQNEGKTGGSSVTKTDWRAWAIAAILLIAFAGTLFYTLSLRKAIESAEAKLSREQAYIAMLNARDTNVTSLAPTGDTMTVPAKVLWNPNQKKWMLVADGMPAAPADKSYQLWFIVNGQKISGGVFRSPDEISSASIPAGVTSADVIAITLEKAGGSTQPEGPIILAGKAS